MTVTAATTFINRSWADMPSGDRTAITGAINALETHIVGPTPGHIPPTASPTSPDIADNATITPTYGRMRYTPAAARTGLIIANGTVDGQMFIIENDSANSMTMATAATSHVADGTSAAVAALRHMIFTWDATAGRWYRTG